MQPRKSRPLLLEVKRRHEAVGESARGGATTDISDAGDRPLRTMIIRSRAAREAPGESGSAPSSAGGETWFGGISISGFLPAVKYDAHTLTIGMSWAGAAVVGGALLVLLIAVFVGGRMSAVGPIEPDPAAAKLDAILGAASPAVREESARRDAAPPATDGARDASRESATALRDSGRGGSPAASPATPPPRTLEPVGVAVPNRGREGAPREAPPTTKQPEDLPKQKPAEQDAPKVPIVDESALQKGRSHLLIQYFTDEKAALKAAAFLSDRGVPCMIVKKKKEFVLYGAESYSTRQDDAAAAREELKRLSAMKERVKQVGKEYFPIGGYAFERAREIFNR